MLPELAIDDAVWSAAFDPAQRARSAGIAVPAGDILIAACARHHPCELEHADSDFSLLAKLKCRTEQGSVLAGDSSTGGPPLQYYQANDAGPLYPFAGCAKLRLTVPHGGMSQLWALADSAAGRTTRYRILLPL